MAKKRDEITRTCTHTHKHLDRQADISWRTSGGRRSTNAVVVGPETWPDWIREWRKSVGGQLSDWLGSMYKGNQEK